MSANPILLHLNPSNPARKAPRFLQQAGGLRFGAIAAAVALFGSVAWLPAHALSLGRITVQSALGEPLRAEIDVSEISPQEASSLNARLGSAEAFKAAGLEFSQVLNGVEINLQRRADGRSFLRLRGNRPISEPFLDLLIQTSTANGSLSRDYAILLDPPAGKPAAVAALPVPPSVVRPSAPAASPRTGEPGRASATAPAAAPAPSPSPGPVASSGERKLTVKPGETAGKIATQNKAEGVSLDQMLVAMQRGNPEAFIGGNINRIKSGAVISLPGAEAASVATPAEARQSIVAQSKDFNAFRRNLAQSVPAAQIASADRAAGGSVTAQVDDRAAANATPDKLTLSKGAVQPQAGVTPEETIARNRQSSDTSARVAELSKNIADLNKLGTAPGSTPVAGSAAAVAGPGIAGAAPPKVAGVVLPAIQALPITSNPVVPPVAGVSPVVPADAATAAPAATAAVAAAAPVSAPAAQAASAGASDAISPAVASAPVAAASVPVALVKPAPLAPASNGIVESILNNPLILPLGAGLLALLAGFGIYRFSRRNQGASVDSSFLESRLQPDSFFGASGGQRIDTNEGGTGSSLVYSPSQLDAAGDVDPVAEADVYLAYGRDLQAEEILKEALRTTPLRSAIHAKLCEIYAKRRDAKSFLAIAGKAQVLTKGTGPEWSLISEMGRELDAANPLYKSAATGDVQTASAAPAPVLTPIAAAHSVPADIDFDLDLDFGSEPEPSKPTAPSALTTSSAPATRSAQTTPSPLKVTPPSASSSYATLPDLDLDLDFGSAPGALDAAPPDAPVAHGSYVSTFASDPVATPAARSTVNERPAASAPDSGMLEFDLDSLSLDLGTPNTLSPSDAKPGPGLGGAANATDSPLDTKFSLAEEFRSLGDAEGARSLAQEVVAEAQGPLKAKAQAFLNTLA